MLRAKRLKPWQDGLTCDECGRAWHEIHTPSYDGPDDRGFVSLFGALGDHVIKRKLCPQCVEDLIDVLANSVDRSHIVRSDREYTNERCKEILWGLMPLEEPDAPINWIERRRQRGLEVAPLLLVGQPNEERSGNE